MGANVLFLVLSSMLVLAVYSAEISNRAADSIDDSVDASIRSKRETVDSWVNDFNSFKNNVEAGRKFLLTRRNDESSVVSPEEKEEQKRRALAEFQDKRMKELEQKVEKLNESIEKSSHPSQFKVVLKGCWAGAYAFAIPTGVGAAISANPFLAVVAAVSGAVGAVCNIVEANIAR